MIVLKGSLPGVPSLPGEPWHASAFQAGADADATLVVVFVQPSGEAMGLVTTYDLDDTAFAAASSEWSWWRRPCRDRMPAPLRARSSVGERSLHTREVAGSKPAAPITRKARSGGLFCF